MAIINWNSEGMDWTSPESMYMSSEFYNYLEAMRLALKERYDMQYKTRYNYTTKQGRAFFSFSVQDHLDNGEDIWNYINQMYYYFTYMYTQWNNYIPYNNEYDGLHKSSIQRWNQSTLESYLGEPLLTIDNSDLMLSIYDDIYPMLIQMRKIVNLCTVISKKIFMYGFTQYITGIRQHGRSVDIDHYYNPDAAWNAALVDYNADTPTSITLHDNRVLSIARATMSGLISTGEYFADVWTFKNITIKNTGYNAILDYDYSPYSPNIEIYTYVNYNNYYYRPYWGSYSSQPPKASSPDLLQKCVFSGVSPNYTFPIGDMTHINRPPDPDTSTHFNDLIARTTNTAIGSSESAGYLLPEESNTIDFGPAATTGFNFVA